MVVKFDELRVLKTAEYWINRTAVRNLLPDLQIKKYANDLSQLAHQLNTFAKKTKAQKYANNKSGIIRESGADYQLAETSEEYQFLFEDGDLFSPEDIQSLQTTPDNET